MAIGSPTSLTPTVIFSLLTVTGAALGLCGAVFYLHLSQPYGMSRRRAVSDMGLPSAVSLNLILDEATPSEKYETWLLNYTEWGEGTTLSSFLAKEDHLCNQQLTKDGGMTHWVLVDADGSSQRSRTAGKARQILASCDTIRRRALVAVRSDQGQVEVKDAVAHCLFSVFCREEFRGKGYARRMMEELKKKLDDGAQDEATKPTFSVVYSDIGKVCILVFVVTAKLAELVYCNRASTPIMDGRPSPLAILPCPQHPKLVASHTPTRKRQT